MTIDVFYEADADPTIIQGRRVAILGYGRQRHAHAWSLRGCGADVVAGLPLESKSRAAVSEQGPRVLDPAGASAWSDTIMVTPKASDQGRPRLPSYREQAAAHPIEATGRKPRDMMSRIAQ